MPESTNTTTTPAARAAFRALDIESAQAWLDTPPPYGDATRLGRAVDDGRVAVRCLVHELTLADRALGGAA